MAVKMKGKEGEGKLLRLLSLSLSPDKPTSADLFPFLREREGGQFGEEAFHSPSPLSQATTITPTLSSAAIIEEKRKGACEESCEKVPPAHSAFFLSGSECCELSVFVSYDTWIPAFPIFHEPSSHRQLRFSHFIFSQNRVEQE